jgi:hypothetical protein
MHMAGTKLSPPTLATTLTKRNRLAESVNAPARDSADHECATIVLCLSTSSAFGTTRQGASLSLTSTMPGQRYPLSPSSMPS